jgi:putative DNA primase/helicase
VLQWDSDGFAIPNTLRVQTARGCHFYFAWPTNTLVRNSASKLAPGLDVRGEGGYVIAPPSVHKSGHIYKFSDPALAPNSAPGWLLRRIEQAPEEICDGICENHDAIPKGKRNDVLASLAGTMRRKAMTVSAIEAALLEENQARCKPPLPKRQPSAP